MSKKYRPPVAPMFAETHEDLPLFSGAPVVVEEKPWNPQPRPEPEAPSVDMFSSAPAAPGYRFSDRIYCERCARSLDTTIINDGEPIETPAECQYCAAPVVPPAAAPEPETEKCQHLGDLRMRDCQEGGQHYYIAGCPSCGRRGARRRTTKGAAAALRRVLG